MILRDTSDTKISPVHAIAQTLVLIRFVYVFEVARFRDITEYSTNAMLSFHKDHTVTLRLGNLACKCRLRLFDNN